MEQPVTEIPDTKRTNMLQKNIASEPNPKELYKIGNHLQEIKLNHPKHLKAEKLKMEERVRFFFQLALEESGGIITEDILMVADNLYVTGMPRIIASSLGIRTGKLRQLLARSVEKKCKECQKTVVVKEERNIHGYSEYLWQILCADCKKVVRAREENEKQAEIAIKNRVIQLDASLLILNSCELVGNSGFQNCIIDYGRAWQSNYWFYGKHVKCGCMICGIKPFRVYGKDMDQLSPCINSIWEDQQNYNKEFWKPYAPFKKNSQAFVRFSPEWYFALVLNYPILEYPLVMLCDSCASHNLTKEYQDLAGVAFD